MKLLSPVDAMFVRMESKRTPMHIGALMIFELPDGAAPDFAAKLHTAFSQLTFLPWPFDSVVHDGPFKLMPSWRQVEPDPEYHVRLNALPFPGTDRELGTLVSRLHSNPLDFDRPLWEAHIIEGLSDRRFAFYFKAHHCAVDGMGAVNTIKRWLSTNPEGTEWLTPVTSSEFVPDSKAAFLTKTSLRRVADGAVAVGELTKRLGGMFRGANSSVRAALKTPRAPFNTRLTQQRRLAIQSLELARLRAIAKSTGTTVNDVTLAVCSGAIRNFLLDAKALPKKSLTASVPVGFERDEDTVNAATGFVCPLGTDEVDPIVRLRTISAATARGKKEILAMTPNALQHYTVLGLLPLTLGQKTGALTRLPPLFNFTVSNVVLSKETLYLNGARLASIVPVSFLCDGYGLNVTLVGYTDKVVLGFVGCRDTLPHLQNLAKYAGEALHQLELAAGVD
ncbi:wax ester/triacylglycerol synthase family O-acyltransferase [Antrihabitans sp. YC2-6]|uniref:WS/DGAT/MGAT family O-acyltransferase n=1 Tax=Antrihabitans sp. YC2-6 TaxID=2799498 RepID=UPI0018F6E402|nr:wax ester/triacylglycerol synthase family O-acyltransferase [Antrihabitans sp. YC2-6]MBJ8348938.1 wax ester/triacylglycerol synthase family O-acyltransferase [Antrihabitans sp. YC2-6]